MKNTRIKQTAQITIAAVLLVWTGLAQAAVQANTSMLNGIRFENQPEFYGRTFELQGLGLKTKFLFKAFVAGLYFEEGSKPNDPHANVAKRIEVEYLVPIPGHKLNAFTIDTMKDNITDEEFQQIAPEVGLMKDYFVDLKPGDRYALTYIPGAGTKFTHNGQLVGSIKGEDFARALFSTWLGENSFDNQLKENILGQSVDLVRNQG